MFQRLMVWSAYGEVGLIVLLTGPTYLVFAKDEPPFILGLSIYAIFTTALGRISGARVEKYIEESDKV